jgi:hypothetical protein
MWDVTNPISIPFFCVRYSFSPLLYVIHLHFSHDRPNWSFVSFPSTTFKNFPGISDLLSEVFEFQHHKMLGSECKTLLVSSLSLSPICGENNLLLVECYFCYGNRGFNFPCTYYIICYHATQIVEIFHILLLLLSIIICTRNGWFENLITLVFFFPLSRVFITDTKPEKLLNI